MRAQRLIVFVAVCLFGIPEGSAQELPLESGSQPHRSDSLALHKLLREADLAQNAMFISQAASRLSPSERFDRLAQWVLPNQNHPTFRLNGDLFPSSPCVPQRFQTDSHPHVAIGSPIGRYLELKETLALPALDLLQTAKRSGRLEELKARIVSASPASLEEIRFKTTLLFLVEVARQDHKAAEAAFDDLVRMTRNSDRDTLATRWRDLLVMWSVLREADIRRLVGDYFFSFYEPVTAPDPDPRLDVLMDYMRAAQGLYRYLESQTDQSTVLIDGSYDRQSEWLPYSFSSAISRGYGRSRAIWAIENQSARKYVGHETDYLSYRIPLRGDFEVECDISTRPGETGSLMVAGTYVEGFEQQIRSGDFRAPVQETPITPQLTSFGKTVHHLAVVKERTLTHYINGRPVLTKRLAPDHDPWIAVRSPRRSQTSFSNFRISGKPVIPAEIRLVGDPDAEGWSPYYEDTFGINEGTWGVVREPRGGYAILGQAQKHLAGSRMPHLLRYHRPIVEDGTIEYEFFYQPGFSCVFPAIDRMALLLEPAGVRIHWITDGIHDRSGLDPFNETIEPKNQRGPRKLPLIEDDWNKISLRFDGSNVLLTLNGQLIYERELDPENLRTFGLFYFSDRTEAYARNLELRGDWPKQLPPLEQQQLADTSNQWLDETRKKLPEVFHFDFHDDLPPGLFYVEGDRSQLQKPENGLRLLRGGPGGVLSLRACLQVGGDYDIVAAFESFDYHLPVATDYVGIGLMAVLDNESQDACAVYRHCNRGNWDQHVSFVHEAIQDDGSTSTFRRPLIEDGFTGRLRLARRGNDVFGLFAEADSTSYRLIYRQTVSPGDIDAQGLRLVTQCGKGQGLGVTLKELEIRAERIYGLPINRPAPIEHALDARRRQLETVKTHLQDKDAFERQFQQRQSAAHDRSHTRSGMRLKFNSVGEPRIVQYQSLPNIHSMFDVQADLQINQLDKPPAVGQNCGIVLKGTFQSDREGDKGPIGVRFSVRQPAFGGRQLLAQVVVPRRGGVISTVTIRSLRVDSPDSLRLAIHENKLYFLYSEASSDSVQILADYPISSDAYFSNCELESIAAGNGRIADVTWKSLTLYRRD